MAGGSADECLLRVERVAVSKFTNAAHKQFENVAGELLVLADRLEWRSPSADAPLLLLRFSQILSQRQSPEGKPKVQLQLRPREGEPTTLRFHAGDTAAQLRSRDAVRDVVSARLGADSPPSAAAAAAAAPSTSADIEAKKKLLAENAVLRDLYRDLVTVGKGVISAAEFWSNVANRKNDSVTTAPSQEVGVSSDVLSDIPRFDGCNGLKLSLSSETIQSIFKAFPIVKRKHVQLVPRELSEQEFWTKFFQSQYFHRDRGKNQSAKELFADLLAADDAANRPADSALLKLLDAPHADDADEAGSSSSSHLSRRFNHYSGHVLNACLGASASAPSSSSGVASALLSVAPSTSSEPSAKRQRKDMRLPVATAARGATPSVQLRSVDVAAVEGAMPQSEVVRWREAMARSLQQDVEPAPVDSDEAFAVLTALCPPVGESFKSCDLDQLKSVHFALLELLRHFWCCFPPISAELEKKAESMLEALVAFESTRLQPAARRLAHSPHYSLQVNHYFSMVNAAKSKFESWKSRKTKP